MESFAAYVKKVIDICRFCGILKKYMTYVIKEQREVNNMPRPKKCRKVCCLPRISEFYPARESGPPRELVVMTVDEYEAIRLIDNEGFSQEECSEYMGIARTTVQQIYLSARKKIARTLVEGLALKIDGGDYRLCDGEEQYCGCGGCWRHRLACIEQMQKEEQK